MSDTEACCLIVRSEDEAATRRASNCCTWCDLFKLSETVDGESSFPQRYLDSEAAMKSESSSDLVQGTKQTISNFVQRRKYSSGNRLRNGTIHEGVYAQSS